MWTNKHTFRADCGIQAEINWTTLAVYKPILMKQRWRNQCSTNLLERQVWQLVLINLLRAIFQKKKKNRQKEKKEKDGKQLDANPLVTDWVICRAKQQLLPTRHLFLHPCTHIRREMMTTLYKKRTGKVARVFFIFCLSFLSRRREFDVLDMHTHFCFTQRNTCSSEPASS